MKSKIPTLLAIFILTISTGIFLFTVGQVKLFTSSAEGSNAPQDVKITNIKDTSATISWLTDTPSIASIKYSSANGQSSQNTSEVPLQTHYFLIQNLTPNTVYSIEINGSSNSWQLQTLNKMTPEEGSIASGQLTDSNNFPAKNAIVYVNAGQDTFSTTVSTSGNWIISLPSLADLTQLTILAEQKPNAVATAKINLKDANPAPPMTIGQSYDFTNTSTQKTTDVPNLPIQLP